jgi:serine/threonine protein kinase
VILGKPYDKKVDFFSIGVITYLLLTGTLPFDDENSEKEILRQTVQETTPFPSKVWNRLSKESKDFTKSKFLLLYE